MKSPTTPHPLAWQEFDFRRIVKGLHRLGYLMREDTEVPTPRRNEKVMSVCEHVLGRKLNSFSEVTEAELAEVASVVSGKYRAPKAWRTLARV